MTCPLCGSKVLYQGLTSLECAGRGCKNGKTGFVLKPGVWIKHPTFRAVYCVVHIDPTGKTLLLDEYGLVNGDRDNLEQSFVQCEPSPEQLEKCRQRAADIRAAGIPCRVLGTP